MFPTKAPICYVILTLPVVLLYCCTVVTFYCCTVVLLPSGIWLCHGWNSPVVSKDLCAFIVKVQQSNNNSPNLTASNPNRPQSSGIPLREPEISHEVQHLDYETTVRSHFWNMNLHHCKTKECSFLLFVVNIYIYVSIEGNNFVKHINAAFFSLLAYHHA